MQISSENIQKHVDHLFREKAGQMVATLTRFLGPQNLDLAENAVQDSLLKAVQVWSYQGIPENPAAWIVQVAKNSALDVIRRDRTLAAKEETLKVGMDTLAESAAYSAVDLHFHPLLKEDTLRLLFLCCHPELNKETQIALTLKTLCGFGVSEIARAFLSSVTTIEQRLVRGKKTLKERKISLEIPEPEDLRQRLDSVLDVLYLLFNEGYASSQGEELIKKELSLEAIRLMRLLVSHALGQIPKGYALLSLMLLQASRFDARVDNQGDILLLEDQDRRLWNQDFIAEGIYYLGQSASGKELTPFHLQASIAACHATAQSFEETNWKQILSDYDELFAMNPSPVILLNRAVAIMMLEGPEAGIEALSEIRQLPFMKTYYLLPATLGEMYFRATNLEEAKIHFQSALQLAGTEPEKRFLQKRLANLLH